jgi:hypothetical protein
MIGADGVGPDGLHPSQIIVNALAAGEGLALVGRVKRTIGEAAESQPGPAAGQALTIDTYAAILALH